MASLKPRINMTTEQSTHRAVAAAAKREGVPVATKAAELVEIGLALEEDLTLAEVATRRMRAKTKYIPHEEAWV